MANWKRQPPTIGGINRGNSIARGLIFAMPFSGSRPVDVVNNRLGVASGGAVPKLTAMKRHIGMGFTSDASGTSGIDFTEGGIPAGTSDFSLFTLVRPAVSNGTLFSTTGAGRDAYHFACPGGSNLSFVLSNVAALTSVITPTSGNACAVGVRYIRSVSAYFRLRDFDSGGTLSEETVSSASTPTTVTGSNAAVLNKWAGTNTYAGDILLLCMWNRQVMNTEFAALEENPWQLFRPIKRRILVSAAAATGGGRLVGGNLVGGLLVGSLA